MGNLKLSYSDFRLGFNVSLRGIYRGRYGFGDFNGNGIVDMDNEYVDSYGVINLTVSKYLFAEKLTLQLEVENMLDHTDPARIPTLPGRSEEHTSEHQSLMRTSYAVFSLKKKKK